MGKNIRGYISVFFALALSVSAVFVRVLAEENVDTLNESREVASAELDELTAQLAEILIRIDELECDSIEKRAKLEETELQYDRAADLLKQQYEEMKLRIQYMYEHSRGEMTGMLLNSEDPAKILNRAEYIQSISDYDRKKLEEYAELADGVDAIKYSLADDLAELEKMQSELLERQQELNELIAEKEEELGNLNDKIVMAIEAASREREEQQKRAAEAASRAQALEEQRKAEAASREAASKAEAASREAASKAEAASREAASKAEAASREAASKAEAASREAASRQAATEKSTEAITERATETVTEKPTEEPTESSTEAPTKAPTESPTESAMESTTEPSTESTTESPTENSTEVPAETAAENPETAASVDIVALAYQLIGTPYRAGGATPEGFDCSGFTCYLYAQIGITLSRTTSGQALGGTPVASVEEAVPGDIICYPGHVGLYVGNGQIIHATVPGSTVKLAPVNYSVWEKVIAIRRYQ